MTRAPRVVEPAILEYSHMEKGRWAGLTRTPDVTRARSMHTFAYGEKDYCTSEVLGAFIRENLNLAKPRNILSENFRLYGIARSVYLHSVLREISFCCLASYPGP